MMGWRRKQSTIASDDVDVSVYDWEEDAGKGFEGFEEPWSPQGYRIGWTVADNVWIEPGSAITNINRWARDQGKSITITRTTLGERLKEAGLLAETDPLTGSPSTSKKINGVNMRVFVMSRQKIFG